MSNSFEKNENDLIELIYKPKPYYDDKTRIIIKNNKYKYNLIN